jgi:predicted RNase H-like HicB family nuclease
VSGKNEIKIEFDEETQSYYIVWEPVIVSSGRTEREALEELREAAHFGVDSMIDFKLRGMGIAVQKKYGRVGRWVRKLLSPFRGDFALVLPFQ